MGSFGWLFSWTGILVLIIALIVANNLDCFLSLTT